MDNRKKKFTGKAGYPPTPRHQVEMILSFHSQQAPILLDTETKKKTLRCDKSDVGDIAVPRRAPKHVVRKYDPEYIGFGFIMTDSDADLKTQSELNAVKSCQMSC